MGESLNQKWIVKLQDGRIIGPYDTERILDKIARGSLSGDEQISKYPGGDWIAISSRPEFYDLLLSVLSGAIDRTPKADIADQSSHIQESKRASKSKSQSAKSAAAEPTDQDFDGSQSEDNASVSDIEMEKTKIASRSGVRKEETRRSKTKKAEFTDDYSEFDEDEDEWTYVDESDLGQGEEYEFEEYDDDDIDEDEFEAGTSTKRSDDIELIDVKKAIRKIRKNNSKLPLVVIAIVLLLGIYILSQPVDPQKGFLSLKPIPVGKVSPMSAEAMKTATARAVGEYLKDSLNSYRSAESQLVKLIAADPKNLNLYGILCLSQFEIWPFARQSSNDLAALDQTIRMSAAVNPTHLY
ncbi:MAG: hypothetical protein AAF202_12420, partial [Pseudomonadota bacterium]